MATINCKQGFTLIELMAVIAIISIVAVISFPVFANLRQQIDLDNAAKSLVTDLRLAQEKATAEQVNYLIVFDIENDSYRIINSSTGAMLKNTKIESDIDIMSIDGLNDSRTYFLPSGRSQYGGAVVLSNKINKQKTIYIKPSGYVKIGD